VAEFRSRRHFEFRPWFDEGAADIKAAAIKALLNDANAQIGDPPDRSRRVIGAKGNLDRHNEHFEGRSAELCRLRELVAFGKVDMLTAINGPDGVGKTALAIEYGHAFAHEYRGDVGRSCAGAGRICVLRWPAWPECVGNSAR
jgi:hypothetical protein